MILTTAEARSAYGKLLNATDADLKREVRHWSNLPSDPKVFHVHSDTYCTVIDLPDSLSNKSQETIKKLVEVAWAAKMIPSEHFPYVVKYKLIFRHGHWVIYEVFRIPEY